MRELFGVDAPAGVFLQRVVADGLCGLEALFDIANNGVQVMGGYGVLKDYDMELFFRDSRIGMIGAGASEIQRTIIARQMGL